MNQLCPLGGSGVSVSGCTWKEPGLTPLQWTYTIYSWASSSTARRTASSQKTSVVGHLYSPLICQPNICVWSTLFTSVSKWLGQHCKSGLLNLNRFRTRQSWGSSPAPCPRAKRDFHRGVTFLQVLLHPIHPLMLWNCCEAYHQYILRASHQPLSSFTPCIPPSALTC